MHTVASNDSRRPPSMTSRVAHNAPDHDATESWRRAVVVERVICLCCSKVLPSTKDACAAHPVLGVLSDAVCPPSRQSCREHVLGGSVEPVCGDLPGSERTGAESLVVSSLEILLVRLQCAPNDLHTRAAWWRQRCCGDTRSVSAQPAQSCIDLAVAQVLQALFRCDPKGYCFVCFNAAGVSSRPVSHLVTPSWEQPGDRHPQVRRRGERESHKPKRDRGRAGLQREEDRHPTPNVS